MDMILWSLKRMGRLIVKLKAIEYNKIPSVIYFTIL